MIEADEPPKSSSSDIKAKGKKPSEEFEPLTEVDLWHLEDSEQVATLQQQQFQNEHRIHNIESTLTVVVEQLQRLIVAQEGLDKKIDP